MNLRLNLFNEYRHLSRSVKNVIASEFFIQLVNATFMNILPLYMAREGFADREIALFITFRFIGVFALAIPLGRMIKQKRLMPLFVASNICVPLFGLLIVLFISGGFKTAAIVALLLWGASFTFTQIPVLPYILRNSEKTHQTAAISLSYSTWSFGGIVSGIVISVLDAINPLLFDEKFILILFSLAGFGGLWFLYKNKHTIEIMDEEVQLDATPTANKTDWPLVIKALIPTLIIATGAGLTIPFISLFFEKVHGVGKGGFSILSFIASLLVAWGAMLVPRIKNTVGYQVAIPTTQSLAVVSLVALATTQFFSHLPVALAIASFCYLLRQPLMNMAGPMTSEIVMNYVGKKNREITSALTSAIWSGSWVVSGFMVTLLLAWNLSFGNIFLITAVLYALGVVLYYLLILDYKKRVEQGLSE